jgi:glyoxylase-like metal-dependent hydrolase (beta-lactamase superfamily II)
MKPLTAAFLLVVVVQLSPVAWGQESPQLSGLDISGAWFNMAQNTDSNATIQLVAYGGYPLNEAGRLYALAWDPNRNASPQQQCAQYSPHFLLHGGGNYRFWEERDPHTQRLIAIKMYGQITEGMRTIWMDGRPHPPAYARHTFLGFSTGKYEGSTLTVFTTHMKRNWIKANGMTQSDQATLVEHFIRHGDSITYVSVLKDPVYLSEPLIRSTEMVRSARSPEAWLYACDDGELILNRAKDRAPSYLFGANPFWREYSEQHYVPLLGAMGGAETMYPEFLAKLKDAGVPEAALGPMQFPTGPQHASRAVIPDPHDGEIYVLPVQGSIYMLVGDGGNIAVQLDDQGPLVVDTGEGRLTDKVIATIRKLSDKPIQFIVNTSLHADRTGGNVKLHAAGEDPSLYGSFFSGQFADAGRGATIIAHQNVQNRMSAAAGQPGALPAEGWPTDTFVEGRRRKYHNNEGIDIFYEPNAITDGDSIVHFRRSDVIVTGDILTTTQYPFIDLQNGGTIQGEIAALNNVLDKTIYEHEGEGGTLVIPGRGRLCDEYEVAEYRDMLAIIRDRVQAMISKNAGLQQVKDARLTADFDDRYGATSGPWTTDMFVEAVYTSLKRASTRQ